MVNYKTFPPKGFLWMGHDINNHDDVNRNLKPHISVGSTDSFFYWRKRPYNITFFTKIKTISYITSHHHHEILNNNNQYEIWMIIKRHVIYTWKKKPKQYNSFYGEHYSNQSDIENNSLNNDKEEHITKKQ